MTNHYVVAPVNPVTSAVIEGVTVTIESERYRYGEDADGHRGEWMERIKGVEVEPDDLPAWAKAEAIEIGKARWCEGR